MCGQASAEGMERVCRELISQGALVDISDYEGKTALICACIEGHSGIATALIGA